MSPNVHGAKRALAAFGGTPVALGAIVVALLVTRLTWPLLAQAPYALLFIAIMIAAQWADEVPGLLSIPVAAAAHALIFGRMLPAAFSELSLLVFIGLALGANRLIVSRRRAEAALRASEAELRSGWEHAAMGAALLDLQGQVIRINPAMARMFGCQTQVKRRVHYSEMMQATDSQEEHALFLACICFQSGDGFKRRQDKCRIDPRNNSNSERKYYQQRQVKRLQQDDHADIFFSEQIKERQNNSDHKNGDDHGQQAQ